MQGALGYHADMVAFASSRASWLLSLAVLGLACTGTREDPSPGDAPPPHGVVSSGNGGGGTGGGASTGGGGVGGGSTTGFQFDNCTCAAIAESHDNTVCEDCAVAANTPPGGTCFSQRDACTADTEACGLALLLLADNDCDGDPACVAALLPGVLDEASSELLFNYFECLCNQCVVCSESGVGGGGVGGGASDGSCTLSPQ